MSAITSMVEHSIGSCRSSFQNGGGDPKRDVSLDRSVIGVYELTPEKQPAVHRPLLASPASLQ